VPDIIAEALFEIDCFRRMQLPDGGIPYGIETNGDPSPGEISWLSTMHAYVAAPNIRDSWFYAGVAARAAKVLKPFNLELAKVYARSAIRAFNWAEADYAKRKADGSLNELKELWTATDARNLSALILYDLTGDKKWHDVFLQSTCLKDPAAGVYWWGKYLHCDAAFLYARVGAAKTDPAIRKNALAAVLRQADLSLAYAAKNAFNLTTMDKYRPMHAGFFSVSGGMELARAHFLTGKAEYLQGVLQSCQFQSGCNPNNIVYTTGLGANPVKHPLHLDSRSSGQPPPVGLTVFGNVDYWNLKGEFYDWPIRLYLSKPNICWPNPYDWPLTEAYFDIFLFASMDEFVVDTWAPNVFVWGFLAARHGT
jgi:endoglucanase